jgi:hypothetical protein
VATSAVDAGLIGGRARVGVWIASGLLAGLRFDEVGLLVVWRGRLRVLVVAVRSGHWFPGTHGQHGHSSVPYRFDPSSPGSADLQQDPRDLVEQLASQEADGTHVRREPLAGTAVEVGGPHRRLVGGGTSGEEARDDARLDVTGT